METNIEPVKAILRYARELNILTILNPAPAQVLEDEYLQCVDIIIPNETEAQVLTGIEVNDIDDAVKAAKQLISRGVGKVIITLGSKGCLACDGNEIRNFDIVDCGKAIDSTGAGDAFTGGFTAALSKGFAFFEAVEFGSTVAGISVTKQGTAVSMPYYDEIKQVIENKTKKSVHKARR
jgi:ribokinase